MTWIDRNRWNGYVESVLVTKPCTLDDAINSVTKCYYDERTALTYHTGARMCSKQYLVMIAKTRKRQRTVLLIRTRSLIRIQIH